jgi:exonuclease SbcC
MRIHRLEVEAIGPFAERVVVDVDELSASGLFLIHGPTGSGKTSLLDAVCFALYADVPGARATHALRSDHAAPGAVPQVVLELTVAGRRLRLTRSPAWQRPKKRGTGTTPVQARVALEELVDGSWRTLSTRNDEVADVVKDLLGMGLAQFAKVVLLPQGDFAAFLRATPEDRREVLERLFDIQVFADVEQWLADQRRSSAAALEAATSAVAADLARLEDALAEATTPAGHESGDDPRALADLPVEAVPARLEALAAELGDAQTTALAEVDAATGLEQLAAASLAEARDLASARARGLAARVRAAALAAEADTHAGRVELLAAAERAETLGGHLVAHDRALADVADADLAVQRARDAAGVLDHDEAAAELAGRVHARDDVALELARRAESAREVAREVEGADQRRTEVAARRQEVATELEALRPRVEALEAEAEALGSRSARCAELELRRDAARDRLSLHEALDAEQAARDALVPLLAGAAEHLLAAQATLIDLRQRRLDGMAAELAEALGHGAPCPVCGATEHPAAAVATDPVSPEAVAAAELALDGARADHARLEALDARHAATAEAHRTALGGTTRHEVEAELVAAESAVSGAREAARDLDAVRVRLTEQSGQVERLAAEDTALEATQAALDERLGTLAERASAARDALADAVEQHADCPCRSGDPAGHARTARALDDLVRAVEEHAAATARWATAATDLTEAVSAAGFADLDVARAARRTPADRERLRDDVARYVRDADAARAVLDEPVVAAALGADPPDLSGLEASVREARRAVLAATTGHDALVRAGRTLERLRPRVEAGCEAVAGLAERHARVRELADAVGGTGGDNTLRMRLTSFVLAARLEKVAALANERLTVMGGGRYLLEHTDDRAARGARSGLGLRVLDQWTGRTRGTASLSGGESFMASLALALGLADAVREESGGLDLGTLFVDEGFGSLDDDSLEQVLTVLDGLREGGRAVGVVSHVADLRARIPYQAVVRKTTTGSHVEVRTGEPASGAPAA